MGHFVGHERISSTFSVLRPVSYLYFDLHFTKFYCDQNCISTCTSRPIRNSDLTKGRSTSVEAGRSKQFEIEGEVEWSKYKKGRTERIPNQKTKIV